MRYNHLIGRGYNRWTSGDYTLGQKQVARDHKHWAILLSGAYRAGKTEMLSRLAIRHCRTFQNAKVGVFRQHLASLKRSTLETFLELVHPSWVEHWDNGEYTLRFKNGSTVIFLGCDFPDRLGSIELTHASIDEAHEVTEEALGMITGRLSGKLELSHEFPKLPKGYQEYGLATRDIRQCILACNPKSPIHYLYKRFFKTPLTGHIAYTSNSVQNVNLPDDYLIRNIVSYCREQVSPEWVLRQIEAVRHGDDSELARVLTPFGQRNMLGYWVAMEGSIYPQLDDAIHRVYKVPEFPVSGHYGAVDWGFNNPRFIVAKLYTNGMLCIFQYWNRAGQEPYRMIEIMKEKSDEFGVVKWFLPPDQPGLIRKARQVLGSAKCRVARNDVTSGIDAVARRLGRRSILFLNDHTPEGQLCWDEMTGYQWNEDLQAMNSSFKDIPKKEADHYPDAVRYLVYSLDFRNAGNDPDDPTWVDDAGMFIQFPGVSKYLDKSISYRRTY